MCWPPRHLKLQSTKGETDTPSDQMTHFTPLFEFFTSYKYIKNERSDHPTVTSYCGKESSDERLSFGIS
jgi:hypothetical protein